LTRGTTGSTSTFSEIAITVGATGNIASDFDTFTTINSIDSSSQFIVAQFSLNFQFYQVEATSYKRAHVLIQKVGTDASTFASPPLDSYGIDITRPSGGTTINTLFTQNGTTAHTVPVATNPSAIGTTFEIRTTQNQVIFTQVRAAASNTVFTQSLNLSPGVYRMIFQTYGSAYIVGTIRYYSVSPVPNTLITSIQSNNSVTLGAAGTFYELTNSRINQIVLPDSAPVEGSFWVLRNNTGTYIFIDTYSSSSPHGLPPNPLVIPPSNSVVLAYTGVAPARYIVY
jgi:hypothetical protein